YEIGVYSDMKNFEHKALDSKFDYVEKFLSAFTRVDENEHSTYIYINLNKQRHGLKTKCNR
ncbi:hypothetical protein S245_000049, partial [Arachis hypogaea]